jgi:hypothetical protein
MNKTFPVKKGCEFYLIQLKFYTCNEIKKVSQGTRGETP